MKTAHYLKLVTLLGSAFIATLAMADNLTINWNNDGSTLLRNAAGNPLSQGAAGTNNDGALIQLGYFSAATTANNFAGTWTPITGATAVGRTTIGDSADLTGAGAGVFQFNTFFSTGTNDVDVYVPGLDDGAYTTQSSVPISTTTPSNGQVLSIRFYDNNTGSGQYNTVSSDSIQWQWKTPDNTSVLNITLGGTLEWESVAVFGLTGTEFRTVLPIPEPSTFTLLGIGLIAVPLLRRRKA